MKRLSRLIALLFCLLTALPALADEIKTSGRYRYEIRDGGAVLVEYTGTAKDIVVPDKLGGKPVVAIGTFAFWQNGQTVSVKLPATVLSIAPSAFGYAKKLRTIVIDNEYYHFEDGALYETQTDTLHTLLFACQREAFTVPEGIKAIASYAFAHHGEMVSVSLPSTLESIGESAFMGCESLSDAALPDALTSLGRRAFYFCKSLPSIDIPSGVKEIPDEAFFSCESLLDIRLPGALSVIGEFAFGYCLCLQTIALPANAGIAPTAFMGCRVLSAD